MTISHRTRVRAWSRREALRAGMAGFATLSLPGLFPSPRGVAAGGLARADRRDHRLAAGRMQPPRYVRPQARRPLEYRGPFATIATRTPGLRFSELLPRQASLSDRFAVLRSMAHTGGGHPAGSLQLLSGDPDPQDKLTPVYPDFMTVAHYLRSGQPRALPNYVGVNPITRYDNFTIAGPGLPRGLLRAVRRDGRSEYAGVSRCRTSASPMAGRPNGCGRRVRLRLLVRRAPPRDRPLGRDAGDGRVRGPGARTADQPRGGAGLRPGAGRPDRSATATAGTSGASSA